MEDANNLVGQFALLPSGEKVIVESVERGSSSALVRRIDGPLAGMPAVCSIAKLEGVHGSFQRTSAQIGTNNGPVKV